MRTIRTLAMLIVLALVALAVYIFSGAYDVGADVPHGRFVQWLAQTVRQRSIAAHAQDVRVPALDDPQMVKNGAAEYASMCSGCHLAPGMHPTEISRGLYPPAPELAHGPGPPPAQAFWAIKHGIKLTAMPAWGKTHDDRAIWNLVAFLQVLPQLTPEQYRALTADAAEEHEQMEMEHGGAHVSPPPAAGGALPAAEGAEAGTGPEPDVPR